MLSSRQFITSLLTATYDAQLEQQHDLIHFWDFDVVFRAIFGHRDGAFAVLTDHPGIGTANGERRAVLNTPVADILLSALLRVAGSGDGLPIVRMLPPHVLELANAVTRYRDSGIGDSDRQRIDAVRAHFRLPAVLEELEERALQFDTSDAVDDFDAFLKDVATHGSDLFIGAALTSFYWSEIAEKLINERGLTATTVFQPLFDAEKLAASPIFRSAFGAMKASAWTGGARGLRGRAVARDALAIAALAFCVEEPCSKDDGRLQMVRFHSQSAHVHAAWTESRRVRDATTMPALNSNVRWPTVVRDLRRDAGYYLVRLAVPELITQNAQGANASGIADEIADDVRTLYGVLEEQGPREATDLLNDLRFVDGRSYRELLERFWDLQFASEVGIESFTSGLLHGLSMSGERTVELLREREEAVRERLEGWSTQARSDLFVFRDIARTIDEVENALGYLPSYQWFLQDDALIDAVGLDRWFPEARRYVEAELVDLRRDAEQRKNGQWRYRVKGRKLLPHIAARVTAGLMVVPHSEASAWRGLAYAALATALGINVAGHQAACRIRDALEKASTNQSEKSWVTPPLLSAAQAMWAISNVQQPSSLEGSARRVEVSARLARSLALLAEMEEVSEGSGREALHAQLFAYIHYRAWRSAWRQAERTRWPQGASDHWLWLDIAYNRLESVIVAARVRAQGDIDPWLLNYWLYIGSMADRTRRDVAAKSPAELTLDEGVRLLVGMQDELARAHQWSYRFSDTIGYYYYLKALRRLPIPLGLNESTKHGTRVRDTALKELEQARRWIARAQDDRVDVEVQEHADLVEDLITQVQGA